MSICLFLWAVEAVRDMVCNRILPAWLLRLDGNVIEMLHRLDVENCAQTALEALKAIFKGMSTEELLQNRVQLDNRCTTNFTSGYHVRNDNIEFSLDYVALFFSLGS